MDDATQTNRAALRLEVLKMAERCSDSGDPEQILKAADALSRFVFDQPAVVAAIDLGKEAGGGSRQWKFAAGPADDKITGYFVFDGPWPSRDGPITGRWEPNMAGDIPPAFKQGEVIAGWTVEEAAWREEPSGRAVRLEMTRKRPSGWRVKTGVLLPPETVDDVPRGLKVVQEHLARIWSELCSLP